MGFLNAKGEHPEKTGGRVKITEVEQHGIESIPEEDRNSGPLDFFRIQFGAANTFTTVLLGTIPIALGLSFWAAICAVAVGLILGSVFVLPMALFGPLNGTNNAVSSGAHFGVRGRIVGSFLCLVTAAAFFSISIWVSGDAVVGTLHRLFGIEPSDWLRAGAYTFFAAVVIVIIVYGYQFMLLTTKVAVYGNTVLMLLGIVAYAPKFRFDFNPGPDAYALGSFWPTFILAALVTMGNPVSFGPFLGDWARYFPVNTSRRSLFVSTYLAQLATILPFAFGVATATLVVGKTDYVGGLIEVSPLWYALLLFLVAMIGGVATGSAQMYGTGLDFSSLFPSLSRVQASIIIGVLSFGFVLVGRFVYDTEASVNAFIGAIIICTMPWLTIMAIGFWTRRGFYRPADLQVFNRGLTGGSYWFNAGFNWRGLSAWIGSAVVALLFANYPPIIEGPFRDVAGGVDLSLPISLGLPAVLYTAALFIFPEPRYAFGPDGARWIPTHAAVEPPVQASHSEVLHGKKPEHLGGTTPDAVTDVNGRV